MSTRFPGTPRTLLTALAAAALIFASAACGNVETQGFRPQPTKQTLTDKTSELTPLDGEEEESATVTTTSGSPAPQIPLPPFLYPNGFEVAMTPPGTVLPFGQPATVATSDSEGRLLVWQIIAHDAVFIPREQVALLTPERAVDVSHFSCYAYDISFLGAVTRYTNDPLVLNGFPDTENTAVVPPKMIPANHNGAITKRLVGGTDNACGIPQDNRLPTTESLLETNHPYARGAVSAVDLEARPEGSATSVNYYFDDGIPGVAEAPAEPAPIRWN